MRVIINALATLTTKTGVGHHVSELTRALRAEFPSDSFACYPGQWLSRRLPWLLQHSPTRSSPFETGPRRRHWQLSKPFQQQLKAVAKWASQFHFAAFTRIHRADLYHEPNFISYRVDIPTVVTVHDLSVLRYPQWHPRDRVRYHELHFPRSIARADHLIVVSEAVRRELLNDYGLVPERVTVVGNGVSPAFQPRSQESQQIIRVRLSLPDHYFLYVGTIEPRKNVATILKAFVDLPEAIRRRCPLLLAGPWGWKSEAEREFFETVAKPRGARHLGYVAEADLPGLYACATALLYPSYYEGFGMPPLEMLACGGPVLASTAEAITEVLGPCGLTIPAADLAGWRHAMAQVACDESYRQYLCEGAIQRAREFTWPRAARATMAVYQKLLGQSQGHIGVTPELPGRSAA